jgi:hypothetical protein
MGQTFRLTSWAFWGLTALARLSFMTNRGGLVIERGTADNPIVGTYIVNPDGTGTMHWVGSSGNHTRACVIVDGGRELQFGVADGQDMGRGVAKKRRGFSRAHKINLNDAFDILIILFRQSQSHGSLIFTQVARDDKE